MPNTGPAWPSAPGRSANPLEGDGANCQREEGVSLTGNLVSENTGGQAPIKENVCDGIDPRWSCVETKECVTQEQADKQRDDIERY